jgi:hypothetical protein
LNLNSKKEEEAEEESEKEEEKEKEKKDKSPTRMPLKRNDKVIARSEVVGYFYEGVITKMVDSRHANIRFESGERFDNLSLRHVIKLNDIAPYLSVKYWKIKLF